MGKTIKIKELNYKDIKWFHDLNNLNEIKKYIYESPENCNIDNTIDWFYNYNKNKIFNYNFHEYIYVLYNEINCKIGYIQIKNHDLINNHAEIGIIIDPLFHNKGYGNISIKNALNLCKFKLKIHKLYCKIEIDNIKSIKIFENNGFKEIATLKDEIFNNKTYLNMFLFYKILKEKR